MSRRLLIPDLVSFLLEIINKKNHLCALKETFSLFLQGVFTLSTSLAKVGGVDVNRRRGLGGKEHRENGYRCVGQAEGGEEGVQSSWGEL